jgi:CheY-like chemotaxis protein
MKACVTFFKRDHGLCYSILIQPRMKNVLLVDDDNVFNFLNTKTLHRMGIVNEIHTALNGKEAIDLLNNYYIGAYATPDVILLDLNMPVLDGFGFLEAFERLKMPNKEKITVIIVTSSNDPRDIERAKQMGITQYLTKPLSEEKLRAALAL